MKKEKNKNIIIKKFSNGEFAFDYYLENGSIIIDNGRKATQKDKQKALFCMSEGTV